MNESMYFLLKAGGFSSLSFVSFTRGVFLYFSPLLEAQSLTKALLETSLYVRLCLSVEQNKNCCTDTWMCQEVAKWFENGV